MQRRKLKMTTLEDKKGRLSPANGVEAETYQAYDWLKTANAAARIDQYELAKSNLENAKASIERAIEKADEMVKNMKQRLGNNQKEFLRSMLEHKSWRNQGIGGWCQESMSQTQRVVDGLVKRKLVKRRFSPSQFGNHDYVLTREGEKVAKTL